MPGRERVTGNGNDMREEKRLRDSLGYRGTLVLNARVFYWYRRVLVRLAFRSLRPHTASWGSAPALLAKGAGVARFYLRHSSAKKGSAATGSTYVAGRGGFCTPCVRVRAAQWRFDVVPRPFKQAEEISRRIPRATRQRSAELSPNPTLSTLSFSLVSFHFSFLYLSFPRPPSSSINHPFSIPPATFSLRDTNIARADQRLDLI